MKKTLSALSALLTIIFALSLCGCQKPDNADSNPSDTNKNTTVSVTVEVTFEDGSSESFDITTDKPTLRAALEEKNLIEGDEGQFGLYVKKVCGVTADYDVNSAYWAFYKNGEYMTCSVDDEALTDGASYQIKYTKD